ncbi:MAG: helix-turn-helix domain-containing protein [Clostridia bacterium]|nr:helix-turn-helix domain-containing protein [Clostridia bacterium]
MSDLYKKVLYLTEECRITVTEMCKQAGVTRSIISEFGAGRTKRLSTGTLMKICEFFGVTTDYLTGLKSNDTIRCPICGFTFPTNDEQGSLAHSEYHISFERMKNEYKKIYPLYEAEDMSAEGIGFLEGKISLPKDLVFDTVEQMLKGLFSQSVMAKSEGHPQFEEYAAMLLAQPRFKKALPRADYKKLCDIYGATKGIEDGNLFDKTGQIQSPVFATQPENVTLLPNNKVRLIPLYESASAGFGVTANSTIIDYMPLFITSDFEAESTMCIKVKGNSMYPKIEDGDIVQVVKTPTVDSGKIAVVLLDEDEGLIKRVVYGEDWIELQSINPEYAPRRFEGAEVQRIRVVGLVKKIIKEC